MINLKTLKNYSTLSCVLGIIFCLLLSGCSLIAPAPQKSNAGPLGVYKTEDGASSWAIKSAVLNAEGKPLTIGDVDVKKILMDPNDNSALYLATNSGLWYSLSAGDGWQQVALFGDSPINDIAVDYFNKCNVFAVAGQSIYRSADCLRTWNEMYIDNTREDLLLTQIVADHYNKTHIYAANNKGEVLKSVDSGKTWQTIKRTNNPVTQLLMDRDDSRIVYVITQNAGIFKTADGGKTWSDEKTETDINNSLNQFGESKNMPFLVQDQTRKNSFLLASRYGLLRTANAGLKWESIPLITPERSTNIYGLAVDPSNAKIIYYSTESTIYKSVDGGKNWATQKSPTVGIPNYFFINPKNTNIIYLGAIALPQ